MKNKDIDWEVIKEESQGRLFSTYFYLNSCCEECNREVHFWCKVKDKLIKHQEKIIKKSLDKKDKR